MSKTPQKTYLVFSDLHNRWRIVEPTISTLRDKRQVHIDQIVFLGDYFDSIGDNPEVAKGTAEWLISSLEHEDRVHLIGNHDLPYLLLPAAASSKHALPVKHWCPGFDVEKHHAIRSILTTEHLPKFKAMHYAADFLFSHAGILEELIPSNLKYLYPGKTEAEAITQYVNDEYREMVVESKWLGRTFPIFQAGDRMGFANPGGVVWADWHTEFIPTPGLNQIVGHSIVDKHQKVEANYSVNYAIDTRSNHVYLVKEGSLEIEAIPVY